MAKANKIRFKLTSNILILLSVAVISTGYLVYKISEYELIKETKLKLLAVNDSKANAIQTYFAEGLRTIKSFDKHKREISEYLKHINSTDENDIHRIMQSTQNLTDALNAIKIEHDFHNIAILEINGAPLITANNFNPLNNQISKAGKIYKDAMNSYYITNTYTKNKRNYVSIIAPIKHSTSSNSIKKYKETIALLIIEIDLEPVFHILNNTTGIGESGESIIVSAVKNRSTGKKTYTFLSPPKAFPELLMKNTLLKGYKSKAIELCFKNKGTGFVKDETDYKGIKTFATWNYIDDYHWGIITFAPTDSSREMITELIYMVRILIFSILALTAFIVIVVISRFTKPLSTIRDYINDLNIGIKPQKITPYGNNEISEIINNLELLVRKRNQYIEFSQNMARGNLDITLNHNNETLDDLANNLTEVRDRLDEINKDNERRKWASEGFNIHSDIMMENSGNLNSLGEKLISSLVNYLKAHQGAIFTLKKIKNDRFENEEDKQITAFELIASYAFASEKNVKTKLFHLGQGLVGQCALEKKTLHLENTPLVQSKIESGLGQAPATNLLLIPLKINEEVLGVLELGGFKKFEPFEIDFLEQLGESIASSLLTLISNERTKDILKENQLVLTLLKQKEKEVLKNQSNLVDLLETLQQDYNSILQDNHKLKKENQELRKRNNNGK